MTRSSRSLQFFHFGLMPYPYIPDGSEIESTWVTLSNKHYDPVEGHRRIITQWMRKHFT